MMRTAPFAISALCLMLSACGGGSNTINENPTLPGSSPTGTLLCASDNTTCVDVVLDDTPVVNVNFECGNKYYGVTNNTGVARCPIDSTISYYLRAPEGKRKINLGTFSIKAVRNATASESQDTSLIRIGVKELAENISVETMTSLDDNSLVAKTAINLSRLLQSLRLKTEPYIETAPVNRVFIDNSVKENIEKLTADVEAKDFLDGTFETKIDPLLKAQNITLISTTEAKKRLQKTILATKAATFYSNPNMSLNVSADSVISLSGIDLGISGTASGNQRANVALFSLTDRQGQTSGYGMYWAGLADSALTAYTLFLKNDFSKMHLLSSDSGIDPYTDRFKNFALKIGQKPFNTTTDANPYQGNNFRFVNGKLIRGLAVFGTETVYKLYTGVVNISDRSELGTWSQSTSAGITNFTGNATVLKTGAVNTFLDPAVWRTKDSLQLNPAYQNYVFPLYATLTISPDTSIDQVCQQLKVTSCAKTVYTLPIVFLENGDIVTDGSNDAAFTNSPAQCGRNIQLDSKGIPVLDSAGKEIPITLNQIRIGTVRAAYPSTDGNQFYVSPSIILSGDQFGVLDGLQIGGAGLSPRVKFNIAGVIRAGAGVPGSLNVTSAQNGATLTGTDPANWVNAYNAFTFQRVTNKLSETDSIKPADRAPDVTEAQKQAASQSQGILTADTSSCNKVLAK